jgi:ElaA protein
MQLHVKPFGELTLDEYHALLKLRCEVFVVEQESPYLEVDDADKVSTHVWFEDEDGSVAAVARIVPAGVNFDTPSIGRVIARKRGVGMGAKIMQAAIDQVPNEDITIEAQVQAKGFYEKFGFVQDSEPFDDCGVMHIRMVRKAY